MICEELERADTAFRVVQSVHVGLNSLTLMQWGTDEQKARWLVPQAKGEKLATFGLTEPGRRHGRGQPRIDRPPRRRLVRPERPEDLDQPRGHRRPLPRLRLGRPVEGPPRRDRVRARAGDEGPVHRHAPRQARHPRGQHGAHQHGRRPGRRRAPDRRGGRGLPDRDERDRPGPVHGRGGQRRASRRPASTPRSSTPTSARRSATRSASTSS